MLAVGGKVCGVVGGKVGGCQTHMASAEWCGRLPCGVRLDVDVGVGVQPAWCLRQ